MTRSWLQVFCWLLLVWIAPRAAHAEPAEPAMPDPAATKPGVSVPQERFQPEQFSKGRVRDLETEFNAVQEALKKQQPLRIDLDAALDRARPLTPGELRQSSDRKFSILDMRSRALQNNLSLAVINFDPQIAESRAGIERAKFDNIIYANIRRSRQNLPQSGGDIVKFSSETPGLQDQVVKINQIEQQIDTVDGELGIAIPLRTGGTVKLSTPFERKKTEGVLGADDYVRATRFSISQPLLRNAGIGVNEASIRIAEFDKEAVDAKTRLQSMRVLSIVDKSYWEVYAAWAELDVRLQQFENANQNLSMVRRRVEEGLSASIETARAEIGVADRIEALVQAKTKLKLAQRQLKFLVNDPQLTLDSEPDLVTITDPLLVNYDFDREKLVGQALAGRLELMELELKLSADFANVEYLQNQTLPMFMLDYSFGALSGTRDSLGEAYNDPFDTRFNDWSIGLRFEMPFTNEARLNQYQRAVQQRMQRLATKTLQEMTIRREIHDVLDQVDQNWQRILAARQQVILAGINYEAELKQFKEGLRTMTEVLEMLSKLGEAQIKEIRAITDYQASLIDLAYATGTLLGYSGVEF